MQDEWFFCPTCVNAIGEMYSREIAVRDEFTCWNCQGTLILEVVEK